MEPKYRVGDNVTIKQLSMNDNYRFGLNSEMIALGGKSYTIKSVEPTKACPGKIPDDGYRYKLDDVYWSWASSMFEETPVPTSASKETLLCDDIGDGGIDTFIRRKKNPELDFSL